MYLTSGGSSMNSSINFSCKETINHILSINYTITNFTRTDVQTYSRPELPKTQKRNVVIGIILTYSGSLSFCIVYTTNIPFKSCHSSPRHRNWWLYDSSMDGRNISMHGRTAWLLKQLWFNVGTLNRSLYQALRLLFGKSSRFHLLIFCLLQCFLPFKFKLLTVFLVSSDKHPHKVEQSRNNYRTNSK